MGTHQINEWPAIVGEVPTSKANVPQIRGPRYRFQLRSLKEVRGEMAKVYRESRSAMIDPCRQTKLAEGYRLASNMGMFRLWDK